MNSIPRVCCACKYWIYKPGSEGEPGYSEWTPGSPGYLPEMKCAMGYWEFDFERASELEYRKTMLKALDCKDFTPAGVED